MQPSEPTFEQELTALINRHQGEKFSDTPDYILASYMWNCLTTFNDHVRMRDTWYGFKGLTQQHSEMFSSTFAQGGLPDES